jgi:hypothetical protein
LDAQSRGLCLSLAGCRHSIADTNSHSHCNGNCICNRDANPIRNGDAYWHAGTEVYSFTEAASYAAAAAVARNW